MKRIYPNYENLKKPIINNLILTGFSLCVVFICWVFRLNVFWIFSFLGFSAVQMFLALISLLLARSYYLKDKGTIIYCDRKNEQFRVDYSNNVVTVNYCDVVDITFYGNWSAGYIPTVSQYFYFKIRTIENKEILLTSYFIKYDFFDDEYFEDLFLRNVELKRKFKVYPIILSVFRK